MVCLESDLFVWFVWATLCWNTHGVVGCHGCHGCHGVGNLGRCRRRMRSGPKRAARSPSVGHAGIVGGKPFFLFLFLFLAIYSKEIPQLKASERKPRINTGTGAGNIRRVVESRKSSRFFHGIARLHVTADSGSAAPCVMGPASVWMGRERDNVRASHKASLMTRAPNLQCQSNIQ